MKKNILYYVSITFAFICFLIGIINIDRFYNGVFSITPSREEFINNNQNWVLNWYKETTGKDAKIATWDEWDAALGTTPSNSQSSNNNSSVPTTPKCDHDYKPEVIIAPSCVEEGENKYTCVKCGENYTEKIEATGNHTYQIEETKTANCIEDGELTYTCSMCEDTYTETVPAKGHNYLADITKEPTCTEDGVTTYTCSECKDTYTEPIEALGHDNKSVYSYKAKIGNLIFEGQTTYTCTRCKEVQIELDSNTYPLWYLIVGIIGIVAILGGVTGIIIYKKRR